LLHGALGLGESYMDGWWECQQLDEFFNLAIRSGLLEKCRFTPNHLFLRFRSRFFNLQKISRETIVGEEHYDLGNPLFHAMLDRRMVYTCAYWKNATNLDEAQEAKLELICQKLRLKKGMKVLDIGCGFGSFAKYAAEKHGVEVVGVTISKEQISFAQEDCKNLPVKFRFQDYRSINQKFDRVVSIGMFEHVGPKNFKTFMQVVSRCLVDDGLFLLHTIGRNDDRIVSTFPWLQKYIFPNGDLPTPNQITKAADSRFDLLDWHEFGSYYDQTLMAWYANFEKNWPELKKDYDERFYRMWKYYLLSCAGAFRSRVVGLWQIVYGKKWLSHYESVR
jgi:cyclopropane-fatty-acyl-phospholipid synthase